MKKTRFQHSSLPDSIVTNLTNRDAALWIGTGLDKDAEQITLLRRLIGLPWQIVLCESTNGVLASSLEEASNTPSRLSRRRGFVHVIASDPEALTLPPRALPVYFLNGREDAIDQSDSPNRPPKARMRRRLNMISRLQSAAPRQLLVLSTGADSPLSDVLGLWDEGFHSYLVVLSADAGDVDCIDKWLETDAAPPAVDHCTSAVFPAISNLVDRVSAILPEDRYILRMRLDEGVASEVDITECELIEQPLFDRYDPIQARDLRALAPDDLTAEELNSFFNKSSHSWRPYAAGLPWQADQRATSTLLQSLRHVSASGESRILIVASERGAGGTTRARTLAYAAAQQGFPTLVARSLKFRPSPVELQPFLYRVRQAVFRIQHPPTQLPSADEEEDLRGKHRLPWLLVFDVQHWEGRTAEVVALSRALDRSGQPTVILLVTDADIGDELTGARIVQIIDRVGHELSEAEVLSLGEHLNRFLRPFGKQKTEGEWQAFWELHRPLDIKISVAAFWITLEFWLRGQFDLSESVQQWVGRHFKEADLTPDLRCLLLEVAALSIERQPYPELLLPASPRGQFPYSVVLEDLRADVPALALIRDGFPPDRQWAMAHDLIGRYLITSVYQDNDLLTALGLEQVEDPIALRLLLLRRVATRPELGRRPLEQFATEFAVKILKLGNDGNLEFARYWKTALAILDEMPRSIWETSRTFNHHVAVSRRRVATTDYLFHLTADEKAQQLRKAIEHLEYALDRLQRSDTDDESDLNLLNSLSLAYQNLAEIEKAQDADQDRIRTLRDRANDAARRAQRENPANSYVLETCARNLIQNGELYPDDSAIMAAEALGYIYQAMSHDSSLLRESRLARLADEALSLLRSPGASSQLERVCSSRNPLGFVGKAWLILTEGEEELTAQLLSMLPRERFDAALRILDEAPGEPNPFLLRFRYDLTAIGDPKNFREQLRILDDLEGTSYAMSAQLQLERAILLHQRNRHPAASAAFKHIRAQLQTRDIIVDVPTRLRWLLTEGGERRICNARVVETGDYRSHARVAELGNVSVPFIPQEFGKQRMPSGMSFRCAITFGAMGPFIKPPLRDSESKDG